MVSSPVPLVTDGVGRPAAVPQCSHSVHYRVLRYVLEVHGEVGVAEVAARADDDRSVEELLDTTLWCTFAETKRLLEAAAELLVTPEAIQAAVTYFDLGSVSGAAEDVVATLQTLDSPAGILSDVVIAATKFCTVIDMGVDELGEEDAVVWARSVPGFPRYPMLCAVTAGFLAMSPQLFGLDQATVIEERCEARGDERCAFRMTWSRRSGRSSTSGEYRDVEIAAARNRFAMLASTVSELVSGENVEVVLQRIVDHAARAVRAPRYLLATEDGGGRPPRAHARGFSDDEMAEAAAAILEGDVATQSPSRIVVDVRSAKRWYGRLAAINVEGVGFFEDERVNLEAYAELAAVALDSATAVAEAQAQREAAEALLDLARAVGHVASAEDVARRLASTTPQVVGATTAGVFLWDGERLRMSATYGISSDAAAALDRYAEPLFATEELQEAIAARMPYFLAVEQVVGERREALDDHRTVSLVVLPLAFEDQFFGVVGTGVDVGVEELRRGHGLVARLVELASLASTAFRNSALLDHVRHQSLHDPLTGTPNQRLLEDRVERAVARARREGTMAALLFIDLDRFKHINDTLGHVAGDTVLRQIADRLRGAVREIDTVSRQGGDEFVVLLPEIVDPVDADVVARQLLTVMQQPLQVAGQTVVVNASLGVVIAPRDGESFDDLLQAADTAMYAAKAAGRGTHRVYTEVMGSANAARLALEPDLRLAIERSELRLYFQPQLDLTSGAVVGAEALVRWQHPERGLLDPDDFIALAEETGLVRDIDAWVLRTACHQLAAWRASGWHELGVAVNVSERDLLDTHFADRVGSVLHEADLDPDALELEISGRIASAADGRMRPVLDDLHRLGVRVAVDDFGTGSSGLSRLLRHRVDTLKIDTSFVQEDRSEGADAPHVRAMAALGHSLGLVVAAEGVETADQADMVRRAGCDVAQGTWFHRPLEAAALAELLAGSTR